MKNKTIIKVKINNKNNLIKINLLKKNKLTILLPISFIKIIYKF